jgi:hypothetical protein
MQVPTLALIPLAYFRKKGRRVFIKPCSHAAKNASCYAVLFISWCWHLVWCRLVLVLHKVVERPHLSLLLVISSRQLAGTCYHTSMCNSCKLFLNCQLVLNKVVAFPYQEVRNIIHRWFLFNGRGSGKF